MTAYDIKPKIVISSYDDIKNPYYGGGGARSIHEVASRLAHKFDFLILTANYPGAKSQVLSGVEYKRIGPAFIGPKFGQLLFHVMLPFYVRSLEYDLWIENLTPPFSTSCLQLYTKKPVVGLVHMLAAEDMERKYKLPFHLIENLGLRTYRYFITPAEITAAKLAHLSHQPRTFTIPNGPIGVDQPLASLKSPVKKDYILYLGRLEVNQKGLDLLLTSFKKCVETSPCRLVIAGSGTPKEEQKVRTLIKELGLIRKVKLIGQVEGRRKQQLLGSCQAMAVPSRLETFGMVALEAMHYGKPVVTFDIPGFQWIPEGCALKATAFDTDAYAAAMTRVLTDKGLKKSVAVAARQSMPNYSWDRIATRYSRTIIQLLKTPEAEYGK